MSGVWVFMPNGVIKFIDPQTSTDTGLKRNKASLVHLPSGNVVSSYTLLDQILRGLGWERYYEGNPNLLQFHKCSSVDLISLPWEFSKFSSVYMYDIVVKNPNIFQVRHFI